MQEQPRAGEVSMEAPGQQSAHPPAPPGGPAPGLGSEARLAWLLGSAQAAETAIDALILARFIEQLGAAALPLALALRAVVDAVGSIAAERALGGVHSARRISAALGLGWLLCGAMLLAPSWHLGIYGVFVLISLVTRQRAIDFGVLALEALPRGKREAALPTVYAAGRVGSMLSGGLLLLAGSSALVAIGAMLGFALAFGWAGRFSAVSAADAAAPASEVTEHGPRSMLLALLIGAVALAVGRVALVTQSGEILAAAFDEQSLVRVLGAYNIVAALVSLGLQLTFVRGLLGRGKLPWVNGSWGIGYLLGQLGLGLAHLAAVGWGVVGLALGARLVDGELRSALRGPITNLLYEAMPRQDRRRARTWVIGVAVPLGGLVAGLLLHRLGSPSVLAWVGIISGAFVCATSLAQGLLWSKARLSLSSDREQS